MLILESAFDFSLAVNAIYSTRERVVHVVFLWSLSFAYVYVHKYILLCNYLAVCDRICDLYINKYLILLAVIAHRVVVPIVVHCRLNCAADILQNHTFAGGKNTRGIRVSSYDPDDPSSQPTVSDVAAGVAGAAGGAIGADGSSSQPSKTLGNQRKFMPGSQRVATISQPYNEKTMLLSSDDEYQ